MSSAAKRKARKRGRRKARALKQTNAQMFVELTKVANFHAFN